MRYTAQVLVLAASSLASSSSSADLVVAQVAPFSGPLAPAGEEMNLGAKVYFDAINERGGVHGERLQLVARDDAYKPAETVRLVKEALVRDKPIALFGLVGTLNMEALLKAGVLNDEPVPVVGISSGARSLREPLNRNLFHVRASYRDEVRKIVSQLAIMGISRIAAFYQDDPLGLDAMAALETSVTAQGLSVVARAPYQRNSTKVETAIETIANSDPQAIVLLSNTRASIDFVKRFRTPRNKGVQIIALSITDGAALAGAVGVDVARGIGISQVMPHAYGRAMPLVREFQHHLKRHAKAGTEPSYSLLEGYVGAMVLVEALRRAGSRPTREKVTAALESIRNFDIGGFFIDFSPASHEGSRYVDLTVLGGSGKPLQ